MSCELPAELLSAVEEVVESRDEIFLQNVDFSINRHYIIIKQVSERVNEQTNRQREIRDEPDDKGREDSGVRATRRAEKEAHSSEAGEDRLDSQEGGSSGDRSDGCRD